MKILIIVGVLILAGCAGITGYNAQTSGADVAPPIIAAPDDMSPLGLIGALAGAAGSLLGAGVVAYRNRDPKRAARAGVAALQEIRAVASRGELGETTINDIGKIITDSAQKQGLDVGKYSRLIAQQKAALEKSGLLAKLK